jgi:glutamate N-acetyltransferase/amino-acid N-acetyltransferase
MSVTTPNGFVAAGVRAGIKKDGLDLAVVRSTVPAVGAAMFTTNRVQAAPVTVSKAHLAEAQPQAVVINSGGANAATGERGLLDAEATAAEAARLLDLQSEQVLVCSTGVIGVRLPLDKLLTGLRDAAGQLAEDGGPAAAEAILTTDNAPKQAVAAGDGFTVGGMAKGAGMIHPLLATMLVVITTDYPLAAADVRLFLEPAVEESFNRISVDGDCSTNDTVILLANGASGIERTHERDVEFARVLSQVCDALALQVVQDGEGATALMEVLVRGAASEEEAVAVARRISTSLLVKTAAFGRDPNWGRVLAAAGSAPVDGGLAELDPARVTLSFDRVCVFEEGLPTGALVTPSAAKGAAFQIELDLGVGVATAFYRASDLSYDYVRINAEYTT